MVLMHLNVTQLLKVNIKMSLEMNYHYKW